MKSINRKQSNRAKKRHSTKKVYGMFTAVFVKIWYTVISDIFNEKYGKRIMELQMTQEERIKELELLSIKNEIELKNLQIKYDTKESEANDLKNEVTILRQQLAFYKKMIHGQKSEKTEIVMEKSEQVSLFNEAETEATSAHPEREVVVEKHTRKAKRTHEEAFENLPIEEVIHEADEKICEKCGEENSSVIPKTGHNYMITDEEREDGSTKRTYTCTICGNTYVQDLGNQTEKVTNYVEYLFAQYSPYMIWVFLATAGVWSIVMGVMFAIALKNEDKEKAKKMIVNYVIGLIVIFCILVAAPYLVRGIAALVT